MKQYYIYSQIKSPEFIKGVTNIHLRISIGTIIISILIHTFIYADLAIPILGLILSSMYVFCIKYKLLDSILFLKIKQFICGGRINRITYIIGDKILNGTDNITYIKDSNNSKNNIYITCLKINGIGSGILTSEDIDRIGNSISQFLGTITTTVPSLQKCSFITTVYQQSTTEWKGVEEKYNAVKLSIVDAIDFNSNKYLMYISLEFSQTALYDYYRYRSIEDKSIPNMIYLSTIAILNKLKDINIETSILANLDDIYNKILNQNSEIIKGNIQIKHTEDTKTYSKINNIFYTHGELEPDNYPIQPISLRYITGLIPGIEKDCTKTIITSCKLISKKKSRILLKAVATHETASIRNNATKISTGESELNLKGAYSLMDDLLDPSCTGVYVSISAIISAPSKELLNMVRNNFNSSCEQRGLTEFNWARFNTLEKISKSIPLYLGEGSKSPRKRIKNKFHLYDCRDIPYIFLTTSQYPALLPIYLNNRPLNKGIPYGIDLFTGVSVSIDAHILYRDKNISSIHQAVYGDMGNGKSSWAKSLVYRSYITDKKTIVLDRKLHEGFGEYSKLAKLCNANPIIIGGCTTESACFNILDPNLPLKSFNGISQLSLLYVIFTYSMNRELTVIEKYIITYAHEYTINKAIKEKHIAILEDLLYVLQHISSTSIMDDINSTIEENELKYISSVLSLSLYEYIEGNLKGMLNGETSKWIDWNNPLIIIDTSALLEGSTQLSIATLIISTYIVGIWAKQPGLKNLIIEESWGLATSFNSDLISSMYKSMCKLARSLSLSITTIVHHLNDLENNPALFSLLRESDIAFIYRQSKLSDIKELANFYKLPSDIHGILNCLNRGEALINISSYTTFIGRHIRSKEEQSISDTEI